MELTTAIKLIKKYVPGHSYFAHRAVIAERYYINKTDILFTKKDNDEEPLRNADNRVCSSFYSLLVNQKASYAFTYPPSFDVGDTNTNKEIVNILGDNYAKNCKRLCINAANAGVAWVHYWLSSDGSLKWGVVDSKDVIPIYTNDLEKKLICVLRIYEELDEATGDYYKIYEIWDDAECSSYRHKLIDEEMLNIEEYNRYDVGLLYMPSTFTNVLRHDFGTVPFIAFNNNDMNTCDLDNVKGHIDTYDKVYSGFINDLEDIQEIIFILSGYEGENLGEFLKNLKKYKTVKLDSDADSHSDLRTLTIDIPVEARKELLAISRKAIFEQGQGVDPEPSNFGNASGVALKYLYSLLELKVGLMETEFRVGFGELVRAICRHLGRNCDTITQIWNRNKIANDTELAGIAQQSVGILSKRSILANHPWVEDTEKELEVIAEEQEEERSLYTMPEVMADVGEAEEE